MPDTKKFNLKLEQYLLDELSDKEKKEIESNPKNLEEIERLKSSNSEFFNKFDINKLVEETESKANTKAKIVQFPIKTISTIAAAAACLILTINLLPNLTKVEDSDKEIIYLKGSTSINIYTQTDNQVKELKNLQKANENDKLQITYNSTNSYGVIFSLDGLNNITFHYPESINSSTKLEIGREVNLPTSYTLDNAPHFEKFYLITSKDSFNFELVNKAIELIEVNNGRIISDIDLPDEYQVESITLLKE